MITTTQYKNLDDAFKYFNEKLFDGKLPDVIITLQRKSRTNGYHHFEKFQSRDGKTKVTEIALNPDNFKERDDRDILGTLCHEMVHHWQYSFSEPARRGYHDRAWAKTMLDIGLLPTATGEIGGKMTGQKMTHIIMDGGKFEIACGAFLLGGAKINYDSLADVKTEKEKKKKNREKYTCPVCLMSVWGKPNINVACGDDLTKMVVEEE